MSSPIKIAVLGLGGAGWNIHVAALRQRDDFQSDDVTDPESQRREEAARELRCRADADLPALLAATDADLVVVATPSHLHEPDALTDLQSGHHCIVEKPVATSVAGAERILTAAKTADRQLFVYQPCRFGGLYRQLREVIDHGILGRVLELHMRWFGFARRNDWQSLRKCGGGLLNNAVAHWVDPAVAFCDHVAGVMARRESPVVTPASVVETLRVMERARANHAR